MQDAEKAVTEVSSEQRVEESFHVRDVQPTERQTDQQNNTDAAEIDQLDQDSRDTPEEIERDTAGGNIEENTGQVEHDAETVKNEEASHVTDTGQPTRTLDNTERETGEQKEELTAVKPKPPPRRSFRERKPPKRYEDYVLHQMVARPADKS